MKISAGNDVFGKFLEGGYDTDVITTIYGPAASGKTTACLLAAIDVVKKGGKVIFVDTEGGFSVERMQQLADDYEGILNNIFFIRVNSFEEQNVKLKKIFNLIEKTNIDLLVIDTIGSHYRAILSQDVGKFNKELIAQLDMLENIAKNKKTTVILTNQVYTNIDTKKISIVGGEILKRSSGCLIELQNLHGSVRGAVLRKHKELAEKEIVFKIVEKGFSILE